MIARLGSASQAKQGQPLDLWFDVGQLQLFDPETGRSLLADGAKQPAAPAAQPPAKAA
jgi:multiple sugar transport system ATP-binding protein